MLKEGFKEIIRRQAFMASEKNWIMRYTSEEVENPYRKNTPEYEYWDDRVSFYDAGGIEGESWEELYTILGIK